MIQLTKIRDLDLAPSSARRSHVSAASGLVRAGNRLYVVADDELHLGVFSLDANVPGRTIRLFPGELPEPKDERKRLKPDLETLMLLPSCTEFPAGAMIALGSGSKRNRRLGAVLLLDDRGSIDGEPRTVDLSALYEPLEDRFGGLNVEGAIAVGDRVLLFQRGNKGGGENAIVHIPLSSFCAALKGARVSIDPRAVRGVDLGRHEGVPFCFTDAAALASGEVVFTAVAEDTRDSYNDGPCGAAGVGLFGSGGELRWFLPLDAPCKVEGVDARDDDDLIRLLLVSDADDPNVPAGLFSATMER
jgi:hypothetical protein